MLRLSEIISYTHTHTQPHPHTCVHTQYLYFYTILCNFFLPQHYMTIVCVCCFLQEYFVRVCTSVIADRLVTMVTVRSIKVTSSRIYT